MSEKRKLEDSNPENDEEWIGPLPSDAVAPKKQKGWFSRLTNILVLMISSSIICNIFNFFCITVLVYEKVYLNNLPSCECYEKSYMHRDVISHIVVTK